MKIMFFSKDCCFLVDTEKCQSTDSRNSCGQDVVLATTTIKGRVLPGRPGSAYRFAGKSYLRLIERRGKKILQSSEEWGDSENYSIKKEVEAFGVETIFRPEKIEYGSGDSYCRVKEKDGEERFLSIEETFKLVLCYPETSLWITWNFNGVEESEEVSDWKVFLTNIGPIQYELPKHLSSQSAWVAYALTIFVNN